MRHIVVLLVLILGVNVVDVPAQLLHGVPCLHAALLCQRVSDLRRSSIDIGIGDFVVGEETLSSFPQADHLAGAPHVDSPPDYNSDRALRPAGITAV